MYYSIIFLKQIPWFLRYVYCKAKSMQNKAQNKIMSHHLYAIQINNFNWKFTLVLSNKVFDDRNKNRNASG